MKILHVFNIPFSLPIFLGDQIDYFNMLGSEVHIACSGSTKIHTFKKKWDFEYFELKIHRKFSFIEDLYSVYLLCKYIKKHKFKIVIGHTPKGAIIAMLSSFLCRVKKRIYFRHGLMFETSKGLKRKLLILIEQLTSLLSTEVVCVSHSVYYNSIKYKLSKKQQLLLIDRGSCNGIDSINRFNFDNCSVESIIIKKTIYNICNCDIVIGFVGRLSRDKGINELVDAWSKVKDKNNNVKLFLCGPLDERDPISDDTLLKIKHDSTIILSGEVEDTEYIFSLFSIFILPSFREGLPTVVLEASSMMLPVITTKSTGCIDSIIENETGIFCDIDSESIYLNIQYYIDNPKIAKEHGINGRKFVRKYYNQKNIWAKLASLYLNK